jgi:preprotein translocase subunit SecA
MRRYRTHLDEIRQYERQLTGQTDTQLTETAGLLRDQVRSDQRDLDSVLVQMFALVRELSERTLGMRHYDVQLVGAMALHDGALAEMQTGEGKTLSAVPAVALNALSGAGVHVVTVNEYLARRDALALAPLYKALGLSVGILQSGQTAATKRRVYACDIVYGTNHELGFDYLRDNLASNLSDQVQRGRAFAIVDEADSVLIDEARTPLIISGAPETDVTMYSRIDQAVRRLDRAPHDPHSRKKFRTDCDFEWDERAKTVALTERGVERVEREIGVEHLFTSAHGATINAVIQACRAHALYHRDVDYVVVDGEVHIVDENTGRVLADRRWGNGLHQAVEAKERVDVTPADQTIAQVTYQNFFRGYTKLAGMTGTAMTEAVEFKKIYDLDVVAVPTHRPVARADQPDLIFTSKADKWSAVVSEVVRRHQTGQPVLVGTVSVDDSESLSGRLSEAGVRHRVLNAKPEHVTRESEIVADAGRQGMVTVATNMAGRGVDIKLGGEPEHVARAALLSDDVVPDSDEWTQRWPAVLARAQHECASEGDKVRALGGLYVCGTERHESRRIDNQLRGRSGRQGDPGETRFFVSAEDQVVRLFAKDKLGLLLRRMDAFGGNGQPIESKAIMRQIEKAQQRVEEERFRERRRVLEYDEVLDMQREVVYSYRQAILEGDDLSARIREQIRELAERICEQYLPSGYADHDSLKALTEVVAQVGVAVEITADIRTDIVRQVDEAMLGQYDAKLQEFGVGVMRAVQKGVLLTTIDRHWQEQLMDLDYLRQGVGLRSLAQVNPLVAYKQEALLLFADMMQAIWAQFFSFLLRARVTATDADGNQVPLSEVALNDH